MKLGADELYSLTPPAELLVVVELIIRFPPPVKDIVGS